MKSNDSKTSSVDIGKSARHGKTSKAAMAAFVLSLSFAVLGGCGSNQGASRQAVSPAATVRHSNGHVLGGQQPIVGADIQLYAAGTNGYGSAYTYAAGTSLLGNHVVTTDASGNFTLTGTYICPTATTEVYLVASGGSPIAGQPANANAALMAALGPCGNLTPDTFISINEVTTVAAVWALSPFMTDVANVATSATNIVGLTNAFAVVNSLTNTATGAISGPGLPKGAVLPTEAIDSIADILAACINSAGGSAGDGTLCGTLFELAPSASGIAPTNTVTAALNIAQNAGRNVAALNNLIAASAPFQPVLSSAPAAWTLAIKYVGAGVLSAPTGIAADQAGNIWLASAGSHSVVEFSNTGSLLSGSAGYATGLAAAGPIAIDQNGSAWLAGVDAGSILEIARGGTSVHTGGGLSTTTALAVDAQGFIWAVGNQSVLSVFSSDGLALSPNTGYQSGDTSGTQSLALSPF